MPALLTDLRKLDQKLSKAEIRFNKVLDKRYSDLESQALRQASTFKKSKAIHIRTTNQLGLEKDFKSHFKDIEKITAGNTRRELLNLAKTNEERDKIKRLTPDKINKPDSVYAQKLANKQINDYENKIKESLNQALELNPKLTTEEMKKIIKDESLSFKNVRISATSETEASRVMTNTRLQMFKKAGIKAVRFTAIMDKRTSDFCREHDRKVYEIGSEPLLPNHVHCRSTYLAIRD